MNLDPNFLNTVRTTFQEKGEAWLARLPETIRHFEQRWSIRVLDHPFSLSYNFVAPAVRADGSQVVLKLGVPNTELTTEILSLRIFDGRSMVRLFDSDVDQGALLLERLWPGKMLSELEDDEQATRIAAQVMRPLWRPLPEDHPFPTVARWAQGFERMRARFHGGTGPLPERRVDRAEKLFADLLASAGPSVLLHGDLHHYNILSAENRGGADTLGWCAIDPKGVAGEPEFEVTPLFFNPFPQLPPRDELRRILARRADLLAEALGFDRQKLLAYAEARMVLASWWTIEDNGDDISDGMQIAEVIQEIAGQ